MFTFDPSIKLGDILTIASFVGMGVAAYYKVKADLRVHNVRLTSVETACVQMAATLTQVAVQDNRLVNLENDVRELRHGEGFVLPIR